MTFRSLHARRYRAPSPVRVPFGQFIYRTAAEREGRDDARRNGGDLALTIYHLGTWTRLALKGNPTIMLPLFTPQDHGTLMAAPRAPCRAPTLIAPPRTTPPTSPNPS